MQRSQEAYFDIGLTHVMRVQLAELVDSVPIDAAEQEHYPNHAPVPSGETLVTILVSLQHFSVGPLLFLLADDSPPPAFSAPLASLLAL